MHDTCHGVAGTGKHKVTTRGASKREIGIGCHRDSNGIAKFDLTVHASILLHIVAHFVSQSA